jgi:hypothetical protein
MMTEEQLRTLEVYRAEFEKLKDEQIARIGFRDNLLYVTIVAYGGILSFALANSSNYSALLVAPWATLILGWTYLVNDDKVSLIGKYFRHTLAERIKEIVGNVDVTTILGWEIYHRSDKNRRRRKIEQLLIDEITFVFSGITGLVLFWLLVPNPHPFTQIASAVELLLLLVLGIEIMVYADLAVGR